MKIIPESYGGHYFTRQKIQNARENGQKLKQAKELKESVIVKADSCLAKGAEYYWSAVTSPGLPRNIHTNFAKECPECGKEMTEKYGVYSWICHSDNNTWKMECPNCHRLYPSNDFKSYYQSGLDKQGFFRSESADPKYLINELYPDKDKNCYVDDGFGWADQEGQVWAFVAYYNLMAVWFSGKNALIIGTLSCLTDAFLFTGDMRYADLGLVILNRIADVYPDMHLYDFKDWKPFYNNDGGTGKGKIAGCISEPIITEIMLKAVDLFIPVIKQSKAADLLNELYEKKSVDLPRATAEYISSRIYTNIVREVYKGVINYEIFGNTGMHERSLALASVVAGKSREADEWIDWIFRYDNPKDKDPAWSGKAYGGNILPYLFSRVNRDGFGDEVSPTYNSIWLKMFFEIAKILNLYPDIRPEYDLLNHPRFIKMAHSYIPLLINFEYIPHIGDTGKCGNPGTERLEYLLAELFSLYRSPQMAYVAWRINKNSAKGLFNDICSDNPEQLENELENAAKQSENDSLYGASLPSYGYSSIAMKHSVDDLSRPYLYLYYGRTNGHGHFDTLNIGYYNYRLELMPDLGYPEYTDGFNRRRKEWEHNTVSHNTVVADKSQKDHNGGSLLGYAVGSAAGYIKATGTPAYPMLSRYERSCALVSYGEGKSYVLDCFTVEGTGSIQYLLHGTKGDTQILNKDATVTVQKQGTYAGENIPYAVAPDVDYTKPYTPYDGSGFHYLKDVRHINTEHSPVSIRWHIEDNWDVYQGQDPNVKLDVRMLSDYDSVALAKGLPPQNKHGNMKELDYLIIRKELHGFKRILSCISSWTGTDFLKGAYPVPCEDIQNPSDKAVIIKAILSDHTVDYIMFSEDNNYQCIVENKWVLSGGFCIIRTEGDVCVYALTDGGIKAGAVNRPVICENIGIIEGTVIGFTKDLVTDCFIELKTDICDHIDLLKNPTRHRHVFIQRENQSVSAFKIVGYEKKGSVLKLFIGNSSPILSLKDPADLQSGFNYEISEGMRAWIPLCYEYDIACKN